MIIDKIKTKSSKVRALVRGDSHFKAESLFLITLISEIERIGFDDGKRKTTDAEAVSVINKFIKNANVTIDLLMKNESDNKSKINELQNEIHWLRLFLPVQMTKEDISNVIRNFIADKDLTDKRLMGSIMSHFKSNYAGLYDSKTLTEIIKEII